MPALPNAKHERFAQELAKGKTGDEAYVAAGLDKIECSNHNGFYVYALIDPRNDRVFYIGKGSGKRYAAHHREWVTGKIVNAAKFNRIGEIAKAGMKPVAVCLVEGLEESVAYSLELSFIQVIGRVNLTNSMLGHRSDRDIAIAAARYGLRHIKPFCVWLAQKKKRNSWAVSPEADKKMYWQIVGEFHEMARKAA